MLQKWGKKVSPSKEPRNDMEDKQEAKTVRRIFTPEQKLEILEKYRALETIKEGLGVRASLTNSRP
jgi:hypothetical protein